MLLRYFNAAFILFGLTVAHAASHHPQFEVQKQRVLKLGNIIARCVTQKNPWCP